MCLSLGGRSTASNSTYEQVEAVDESNDEDEEDEEASSLTEAIALSLTSSNSQQQPTAAGKEGNSHATLSLSSSSSSSQPKWIMVGGGGGGGGESEEDGAIAIHHQSVASVRIPCPPGCDTESFYALPESMQREIADEHRAKDGDKYEDKDKGYDETRRLLLGAGIDYSSFVSLPREIQLEILDEARRNLTTFPLYPPSSSSSSTSPSHANILKVSDPDAADVDADAALGSAAASVQADGHKVAFLCSNYTYDCF